MSIDEENFVVNLMNEAKTYKDWLVIVRFGMPNLLGNQRLLAEVIVAQAARLAESKPHHKPSDEVGQILFDLKLNLTPA